ncbi:phosphate acetyltransferase [Kiloniella sp. b19]|uniref:phosphate acetyltransferase n=1 Tax=Kiloniella sp. GXU_MW_B19 TaxID=3141326 RepID=UPI0031E16F49
MDAFDALLERARNNPKHIVLAEGEDPRVVEGALRAVRDRLASVTLLGRRDAVLALVDEDLRDDPRVSVVDPATAEGRGRFVELLVKLRQHKGMTEEKAQEQVLLPQNYANLMVRSGLADGTVAGAQLSTADVVRSAIQIIGVDKRYSMISSFFIMLFNEEFHDPKGAMIFADCGLVVAPEEDELVQIGTAAADNAAALMGMEPRIAMLSFSTRGSASHPNVDRVRNAAEKIRAQRPDLSVDGELQLDAAIVPSVGGRKAPGSEVAGQANVLVFPDLQSGNIGYKLAERVGQAKAIGPVLQGLAKPANDLSRGCDADAVYRMIAVTAVQAQNTDTKE